MLTVLKTLLFFILHQTKTCAQVPTAVHRHILLFASKVKLGFSIITANGWGEFYCNSRASCAIFLYTSSFHVAVRGTNSIVIVIIIRLAIIINCRVLRPGAGALELNFYIFLSDQKRICLDFWSFKRGQSIYCSIQYEEVVLKKRARLCV